MCSADRGAYLCERSVNKVTFLYKCSVFGSVGTVRVVQGHGMGWEVGGSEV